jgi:hypothetical protein
MVDWKGFGRKQSQPNRDIERTELHHERASVWRGGVPTESRTS